MRKISLKDISFIPGEGPSPTGDVYFADIKGNPRENNRLNQELNEVTPSWGFIRGSLVNQTDLNEVLNSKTVNAGEGINITTTDTLQNLISVKIKIGDKILTTTADGINTNLAIQYDETSKKVQLIGKEGAVISEFDASEFVKDSFLYGTTSFVATSTTQSVTIKEQSHEFTDLEVGKTYLVFCFVDREGVYEWQKIELSTSVEPIKIIEIESIEEGVQFNLTEEQRDILLESRFNCVYIKNGTYEGSLFRFSFLITNDPLHQLYIAMINLEGILNKSLVLMAYLNTNEVSYLQIYSRPIIAEAPKDGKIYGRKDGDWEEVSVETKRIDVNFSSYGTPMPITDAERDVLLDCWKNGAYVCVNNVDGRKLIIRPQSFYQSTSEDLAQYFCIIDNYGACYFVTFNLRSASGASDVTVVLLNTVIEAPSDNQIYGRKNGAWEVVSGAKYIEVSFDGTSDTVSITNEQRDILLESKDNYIILHRTDGATTTDYRIRQEVTNAIGDTHSSLSSICIGNKMYFIVVTLIEGDEVQSTIKMTETEITSEAPSDGKIYGRKDKSWAEVTSGGGGSVEDYLPKYLVKTKDYSYYAEYNLIDWEYAKSQENNLRMSGGGCSSVKVSDCVGRSFDWLYDNENYAVVRTPSSLAICGATKSWEGDTMDESIKRLLPFYVLSGMNKAGLYVSTLLVHNEFGAEESMPSGEVELTISSILLPRYILDHFSDANKVVQFLQRNCKVVFPESLLSNNQVIHLHICDKTHGYVVEWTRDSIVGIPTDVVTNFYINGVTFISSGERAGGVYTNYDILEGGHSPRLENNIQLYGQGLERFNLLKLSSNSLEERLTNVHYERLYKNFKNETSDKWFSSDITGSYSGGVSITVGTPLNDTGFISIKDVAVSNYDNRSRGSGETWHSPSQEVWDLNNLTLKVRFQYEDGGEVVWYNHSLNSSSIEEAPLDGKLYGRQNKSWSEVTSSGLQYIEMTGSLESSDRLPITDEQRDILLASIDNYIKIYDTSSGGTYYLKNMVSVPMINGEMRYSFINIGELTYVCFISLSSEHGQSLLFFNKIINIPESPADGKTYGRKDNNWVEIESSGIKYIEVTESALGVNIPLTKEQKNILLESDSNYIKVIGNGQDFIFRTAVVMDTSDTKGIVGMLQDQTQFLYYQGVLMKGDVEGSYLIFNKQDIVNEDAPHDSLLYGRKDGDWVQVESSSVKYIEVRASITTREPIVITDEQKGVLLDNSDNYIKFIDTDTGAVTKINQKLSIDFSEGCQIIDTFSVNGSAYIFTAFLLNATGASYMLITEQEAGNYNSLSNKPTINGVSLVGNQSSSDLKIMTSGDELPSGSYYGQLHLLKVDVSDVKAGLYMFDGSVWVRVANWVESSGSVDSGSVEVSEPSTESISGSATVQKEINQEFVAAIANLNSYADEFYNIVAGNIEEE